MNSVSDYDQLLMELHQKLREKPEQKRQILDDLIKKTECPYLKEKLLALREKD